VSNFSLINKRNIKNSSFYLDEKESHHIISVLRLKKDDKLTLTDGEGSIYHALINDINKKKNFKVEYLEIANAETLQIDEKINPKKQYRAFICVRVNEVRLIDNILLN